MSCKTFCDELEELIERHFDNNEELLVVGDFNVWAEVENDRDVKTIFSNECIWFNTDNWRANTQEWAYIRPCLH